MPVDRTTRRLLAAAAVLVVALVAPVAVTSTNAATAAITVGTEVVGTTPDVLGYNIAHGMAGSNAADWWRYSGARAARVFLSASDIEGTDDIAGVGDGVTSQSSFDQRRTAIRANVANPASSLDPQYVQWSSFTTAYGQVATGNNRFAVASWFPALRSMGVDILVNITASPSRFPLADTDDFANAWELWQHYYAQAFLLSRDYGVARYSMFNEPNGWSPAISVENWARRLRVASDAIQSAVADMNARYGRSVNVDVFAPNTANGATKYDDYANGDYWGDLAVAQRGLDRWGAVAPAGWANFDVYNYQKYTTSAADYRTDYDALRAKIVADVGAAGLPMALTEFNVRTGANYDVRTENGDSPSDYSALGAVSVALAERGASQLYLFKFGMTERTGTYPVAKNGTHYVDNSTSGVNDYGGAAGTAEVYRLFLKASGSKWPRLGTTSTLGSSVAVQATRDPGSGAVHVFVANTATTTATVDLDVAALGITDGSAVTVEEVSGTSRGGVTALASVSGGRVTAGTMPAQSVWLVTVHSGLVNRATVAASADAALADGTGRTTTGGTANPLVARADGTVNGRRVAVLRFPLVSPLPAGARVLLATNVSTTAGTTPTQAHVYGMSDDSWAEGTTTFSSLTSTLEQNVAAGNLIANNVVAAQGSRTLVLGQLMAASTSYQQRFTDVTDFVRSQTDGAASFLIVQDHRWNVRLSDLVAGDTQSAGLRITSREAATGPSLVVLSPTVTPPSTTTVPATTTTTVPATTTTTTTTVPPASTTVTAEAESLVITASSGDATAVKSDSQASGGKSLLFRANAVGDYVTLRLSVPAAGSYAVTITAKMMGDRGVLQFAVADSLAGPYISVDTSKDEYRSSIVFGSIGTFSAKSVFATGGTKYLRFTVVGRNASSSGYNLNVDRITFVS
ncbi:MAG: DUF7594 domain-containing protein [Ilumatobacteraceae bacterium]